MRRVIVQIKKDLKANAIIPQSEKHVIIATPILCGPYFSCFFRSFITSVMIIFMISCAPLDEVTAFDDYDTEEENGFVKKWKIVSSAAFHTCAIKEDGGLYCWGRRSRIGCEKIKVSNYSPVRIGIDKDWISVSASPSHTCALKNDNSLYCWGNTSFGINGQIPTRIGDSDWKKVSCGNRHLCAIKLNGQLYCWGENNVGQLGDGTNNSSNIPVRVGTAADWVDVDAGASSNCAVKEDGRAFCWGNNGDGQLGNGTNKTSNIPVRVNGDSNSVWIMISAGDFHTCAINTESKIYCWGWNYFGELGNGQSGTSKVPVEIYGENSDWISVTAGGSFTCALKRTGELYCWGINECGTIGDGTTQEKYIPIEVKSNVVTVDTSDLNTCAVNTGGSLYCWGANGWGQIGIGVGQDNPYSNCHRKELKPMLVGDPVGSCL